MKVKNARLEWNVLIEDFNSREIRVYNIFSSRFIEELHKEVLKKKITTFEQLKEYIKGWAMYHYWCKSEFEIAVGGLFVKDISELEKIDVYKQIAMNLDRITEYINNELKLNFK